MKRFIIFYKPFLAVCLVLGIFACKQKMPEIKTEPASNADLLTIGFSAELESFSFNKNETNYNVQIKNPETSKLTVTAITEDTKASVTVKPSGSVPVKSGTPVTFKITVTAEDRKTVKVYTVNALAAEVIAKTPSSNAFLKNLVVSAGTLNPVFSKNEFNYTVILPADTPYISVSGVPEDSNSVISAEPSGFTNIQPSEEKLFTLTVKAEDKKNTKEYKVKVKRQKQKPQSPVNLLDIILSTGKLEPSFSPDINNYTVNLPYSSDKIEIKGKAESPDAVVTTSPEGITSLTAGTETPFVITVKKGSDTKNYTVKVTRETVKSTDTYLQSLIVKDEKGQIFTLSPAFSKNTLKYSVEIPLNNKHTVTLIGQPQHALASVGAVFCTPSVLEAKAGAIQTLSLTVKAEAGNTKTYEVTLKRTSALSLSKNALLKKLELKDRLGNVIGFTPAFLPETFEYEASVPFNFKEKLNVAYLLSDQDASAKLSAVPEVLPEQENSIQTFIVKVTAEDTSITKTYKLTVKRKTADSDAFLKELALIVDEASSVPYPFKEGVFTKDRFNYTAEVPLSTKWVRLRFSKSSVYSATEPAGIMSAVPFKSPMTLSVKVTAQNGKSNTYQVKITAQPFDPTVYLNMVEVLETKKTVTGEGSEGVFIAGRTVELEPYRIGECEITYSSWKYVYDWAVKHGYSFDAPEKIKKGNFDEDENQPACGVSWRNAIVWCNAYSEKMLLKPVYTDGSSVIKSALAVKNDTIKMDMTKTGYRLPTEAEWEFAARGGKPLKPDWNFKYSGTNSEPPDEFAWHKDNSKVDGNRSTHRPKQKKPNRLKIYDMSGNIAEWCWDFAGNIETSTPAAGPANGTNRIRRGGFCFGLGLIADLPPIETLQVKNRTNNGPIDKSSIESGFRIACSIRK